MHYVCAIEPYIGSATSYNVDRSDLLATTKVVLSLINKLEETYGDSRGLHLFTDRYYTSVELAKEIYAKGIHLTGTINRNRVSVPPEIKKKPKLKKGEILTFVKMGIIKIHVKYTFLNGKIRDPSQCYIV